MYVEFQWNKIISSLAPFIFAKIPPFHFTAINLGELTCQLDKKIKDTRGLISCCSFFLPSSSFLVSPHPFSPSLCTTTLINTKVRESKSSMVFLADHWGKWHPFSSDWMFTWCTLFLFCPIHSSPVLQIVLQSVLINCTPVKFGKLYYSQVFPFNVLYSCLSLFTVVCFT